MTCTGGVPLGGNTYFQSPCVHVIVVTTAASLPSGPLSTTEICACGGRVGVIAVAGELNAAAVVQPRVAAEVARRANREPLEDLVGWGGGALGPQVDRGEQRARRVVGKTRVKRSRAALRPVQVASLRDLHRADARPLGSGWGAG